MDQLKALEDVLSQYYDPVRSNTNKPQLEQMLSSIKAQRDAWLQARFYMSNSNNQYVLWFSVSIYEELVRSRWDSLSVQEQTDLRNFLLEFLLAKYGNVPSYVCNKIAKVVVDIGKLDWPQKYPDFLTNIQRITQSPQTAPLGVYMLTLVSEEFVSTREDLLSTRKKELKNILTSYLPSILGQLTQILDFLFQQYITQTSASQVGSPQVDDGFLYTSRFDKDSRLLLKTVFDALQHFFGWIQLSEQLTAGLLQTLFKYVKVGDEGGVQALSCLNEIMAKNYVPKEFEDFLVMLFGQIFSILQRLVATPTKLEDVDIQYIEKFTQFTALFVTNHLRRVEANPKFPMLDFLALLFNYTFMQPQVDGFLSCLEIWGTFLDYLIVLVSEKPADAQRIRIYLDGLMMLQTKMQERIQFTMCSGDLNSLDDTAKNSDEDGMTELDNYFKSCIEIIAKVAELFPQEVLDTLYPLFSKGMDNMSKCAPQISQLVARQAGLPQDITYVSRDTGTIMRLVGRLVEHFVGDYFQPRFAAAAALVNATIGFAQFAQANYFYRAPQITSCYTELLGALRAFTPWFGQCAGLVRSGTNIPDFAVFIAKITEIVVALLDPGVPAAIGLAAATLLNSIAATVRPPVEVFVALPIMDGLFQTAHERGAVLPLPVAKKLYVSLTASIVLPQPNVALSQQMWEGRKSKFSGFMKGLVSSFLEIPRIAGFMDNKLFARDDVQQRVNRSLQIFVAIIRSISDEGTPVKNTVNEGLILGETMPVALGLFRLYVAAPQVLEHILDFFLAVFESLKVQVGVPFTHQVLNTFMELLAGEQLVQMFQRKDEVGTTVMTRLLKILTLVVSTPGTTFEPLLPAIISFGMKQIYPHVVSDNPAATATQHPEVRTGLYTLLHAVLLDHWKVTTADHSAILSAFERAFALPDIALFKQVLESLESLNDKQRLYQKEVFINGHRFSLLSTLIGVLLAKSHNLLREEIVNVVYHIVSVDFEVFFRNFLPAYLEHSLNLTPQQKGHLLSGFTQEKDHPSFNNNTNQFINDYSYFVLHNSIVAPN